MEGELKFCHLQVSCTQSEIELEMVVTGTVISWRFRKERHAISRDMIRQYFIVNLPVT